MLRFVWMDKNIGIAVDHVVPGHGTVPLSPYYFWPRKDAWEEIKTVLESKKWISRKQTILLLNQATDVINLWQQNAADSCIVLFWSSISARCIGGGLGEPFFL